MFTSKKAVKHSNSDFSLFGDHLDAAFGAALGNCSPDPLFKTLCFDFTILFFTVVLYGKNMKKTGKMWPEVCCIGLNMNRGKWCWKVPGAPNGVE